MSPFFLVRPRVLKHNSAHEHHSEARVEAEAELSGPSLPERTEEPLEQEQPHSLSDQRKSE